jgi:hypothetical protein
MASLNKITAYNPVAQYQGSDSLYLLEIPQSNDASLYDESNFGALRGLVWVVGFELILATILFVLWRLFCVLL